MDKGDTMKELETAIVGGGCFWCTETVFDHTRGVSAVMSGYAGGVKDNPTYEEVCTGKTGHVEVVKIEYDPSVITYEEIINIFFSTHDPTTPDQQGLDVGSQYRSIILYANKEQQIIARKIINELTEQRLFEKPIVTELVPLDKFYPAEDYHRKYFEKNPDQAYCQVVVAPKLAKFREKYRDYYI